MAAQRAAEATTPADTSGAQNSSRMSYPPAHLPGNEVLELLDLLLVLRVLLQVLVIKEGLEDGQTDRQTEQSELVGREKISDFFRHASESCSPPSSGAVGKKVM